MTADYFIGLDVHKRSIVTSIVDRDGKPLGGATLKSTRAELLEWIEPWTVKGTVRIALESSGSSAWVTYALLGAEYDVTPVHPRHVRAIAETKQKSDRNRSGGGIPSRRNGSHRGSDVAGFTGRREGGGVPSRAALQAAALTAAGKWLNCIATNPA